MKKKEKKKRRKRGKKKWRNKEKGKGEKKKWRKGKEEKEKRRKEEKRRIHIATWEMTCAVSVTVTAGRSSPRSYSLPRAHRDVTREYL